MDSLPGLNGTVGALEGQCELYDSSRIYSQQIINKEGGMVKSVSN